MVKSAGLRARYDTSGYLDSQLASDHAEKLENPGNEPFHAMMDDDHHMPWR
jgi:hypothetical protein